MKKTMDTIKSSIHYRTNALPVKLSDVISIVDSATERNSKPVGGSLAVVDSFSGSGAHDNNSVINRDLLDKQWTDI